MVDIQFEPISNSDRRWIRTLASLHFGSERIVVHGTVFSLEVEDGFIAWLGQKRVGVVILKTDGEFCEIILLDALESREDIFRSLLQGAGNWARGQGCKRLILTTTNDNTDALRIYQQNGFFLTGLRVGAVTDSRKLKPEIPKTGCNGITIQDELELEMVL